MSVPTEFLRLLPKVAVEREEGPLYFLWVFDPDSGEVILEHNEDRHAAEHVDHGHLAERVKHPDKVHGYAYKIRGGWRITTWDHKPVDDPFVVKQVRGELNGIKAAPRKSQVQLRAVK